MVGTPPELHPDRWQLGFAPAVREAFRFLETAGFSVKSEEVTFVRYESPVAYVNVYHGRGSYELGVQIGRWLDGDGQRVEQGFSLRNFIALEHDLAAVGYQDFSAITAQTVAKFVPMLAQWTEEFGREALRGDPKTFGRVTARSATEWTKMREGWEASRLRQAAGDAWRRKDWRRVVNAYAEMEAELRTVELKASEVGRLKFARRHLDAAD